jgi:hypothetical protein
VSKLNAANLAFFTSSSAFVLALLLFAPGARAQNSDAPGAAAPAPIPTQILAAKKVFVANSVGSAYPYRGSLSYSVNETYDVFYAALNKTGRFQLVNSPAEADLVFDLFGEPGIAGVRILDPRTNVTLWIVRQSAEPANITKTALKNIATAVTALATEAATLASPPTK